MAYQSITSILAGKQRVNFVIRDSDGTIIPSDPDNADWQVYQKWLKDGNTLAVAPLPPAPVPQVISDRQFYQQLAIQGVITQDEALAAVKTGAVPSAMQQLIAALPADQQFGATMMIAGATQFERSNPLTLAIGRGYNWTSVQLDALWIAAAAL